jgi:uncharacterized repeat protein (TIGR03803 family)
VFKLTPKGSTYVESVLYSFPFNKKVKGEPDGLVADAAGNLYVSTSAGGRGGCPNAFYGCGSAIKLAPSRSGYRESPIYAFRPNKTGVHPSGPLVIDATGIIYGTTSSGGSSTCENSDYTDRGCGGIFKITPTASGYSYQELYRFRSHEGDGPGPVIADSNGALYGAAYAGGRFGFGTVFKYTLMPTARIRDTRNVNS